MRSSREIDGTASVLPSSKASEEGTITVESASHALNRGVVLLLVLTVALHLPFIGQAFHLDDDQYLDIAANVYHNFWFPLDMPVVKSRLSLGRTSTMS